jgi:Polysaccharide deacetylase
MASDKAVCYTLDLEHDYAGVAPAETYETLSNHADLDRFSDIVRRYGLKLTVFATGRVLEQKRESVERFRQLGAEIELHGYDHILHEPDFVYEMQKGVSAYYRYLGRSPLGYRSPGGMISPALLEALAEAGIKYDSSVIPSFRWGMYSNLGHPLTPHLHSGLPLLELPIGVVPRVRLPIATSYMRLFGLSVYRIFFALFGRPSPLVYLFHLVDLVPVPMRKRLSLFLRCAYARRDGKGLDVFEASVRYFETSGYRPEYMSNLYREYAGRLSA